MEAKVVAVWGLQENRVGKLKGPIETTVDGAVPESSDPTKKYWLISVFVKGKKIGDRPIEVTSFHSYAWNPIPPYNALHESCVQEYEEAKRRAAEILLNSEELKAIERFGKFREVLGEMNKNEMDLWQDLQLLNLGSQESAGIVVGHMVYRSPTGVFFRELIIAIPSGGYDTLGFELGEEGQAFINGYSRDECDWFHDLSEMETAPLYFDYEREGIQKVYLFPRYAFLRKLDTGKTWTDGFGNSHPIIVNAHHALTKGYPLFKVGSEEFDHVPK